MPRLRKRQIDEQFVVEPDLVLVRHVTLDDGSTYAHRCPLESFEQICHVIEEAGQAGTTLMEIAKKEDLPSSQAATARAFLLTRGVIETAPRRRIRATGAAMVEDALTEFHALV